MATVAWKTELPQPVASSSAPRRSNLPRRELATHVAFLDLTFAPRARSCAHATTVVLLQTSGKAGTRHGFAADSWHPTLAEAFDSARHRADWHRPTTQDRLTPQTLPQCRITTPRCSRATYRHSHR